MARAFNVYQDAWLTLSARPLAMGGAFVALSDPASVFYNPAGLAQLRGFRFMHNHSGRHFPGVQDRAAGKHKVDQLDADTQALVVPLPGATYAHGFAFSGEYGYDYRGLAPEIQQGYPRENVWGSEDVHALAFGGGLPWSAGYSLRRQFLRLTPDPDDAETPAWLRVGQGEQWGVLGRVAPGLDYGYSESKLNLDWTLLEASAKPDEGFTELTSRVKSRRRGLALRPAAWLTLSSDTVHEDYLFGGKSDAPEELAGLGRLHLGNDSRATVHRGGELQFGQLARLRWGNYDGSPTCGAALNLGGLWINYAEVHGFLPRLIGAGDAYKNVHVYGFEGGA